MRFPFFRQKAENSPGCHIISIQSSRLENGILFSLTKGSEPVSIPLKLSLEEFRQQTEMEKLELLEDLWYEEWLGEDCSGYILPYHYLYQLDTRTRRLLHLPEESSNLQLALGNEGFIPSSSFRFILEKSYGSWKHLEKTAIQHGPLITLPDGEEILMDEQQYAFDRFLANPPLFAENQDLLRHVAQVLSKAKQLGIPCNRYLARQDYLFVDDLELEAEFNGRQIKLKPRYKTIDPVPEEILQEMEESSSGFALGPHKQKIFTHPKVQAEAQTIRQLPVIQGTDIPKFTENPDAYLPELEKIDLARFGERVKELGIRIYRAQPFVNASKNKRNWFELSAGFHTVDETGKIFEDLPAQELEQLIQQARKHEEEYVEWNNNWIKVPPQAEEFIRATGELQQELQREPAVDITKLPYVLEIFDNFSQLEFNQPILEAKKQLVDEGILAPVPPQGFMANLKPFQTDGFIWMKSLHYRHLGGLLADDMGLGKTIQVISFLTFLQKKGELNPTLIVVPKTLIQNWVNEIRKFAPSLASAVYIHQKTGRLKDDRMIQKQGIVLTTYHTLTRDQLLLGQVDWKAVICDEAQAIKNPTTASTKVIKALKTRFRLAMTGTPVENGLSELWSIVDFVQPGLLGSLKQFRTDFIDPLEKQKSDEQAIEQKLARHISVIYKRRTKQGELGTQLPTKTQIIRHVPLGLVQDQLYHELIAHVQNKKVKPLQAIQRLRALCSHPALVQEQYRELSITEIPKLSETVEILKEIESKQEKALIFTEYRTMQDILRQTVRQKFGIIPLIVNGMTSRRQESVDLFNHSPGFQVMILSPKAAGTGLTITSANHVIHYTRWWNPAVENQATDRVYRIGQEKPVTVYYPIVTDPSGHFANGTVEEIVHRILEEKQHLAYSVIVPSKKLDLQDEVLREVMK